MNNLDHMLRGVLAGVALSSLLACEEVVPQRPRQTTVATSRVVEAPPVVAVAPSPDLLPSPPVAVVEPKVDPDSRSTWSDVVAAAREALNAGQLDRGRKFATMAAKKEPNRSASWNLLGRAQLKKGERAAAITSFEKAVELNPDSSYAHNNLGLALIYAERFDEAVEELEDATDCMPVEGYMWNNLGMAYEHLDRLAEAREAYRKADDMEAPRARENLARLEGVKSIRTTARLDSENVNDDEGTPSPVDGAGGL